MEWFYSKVLKKAIVLRSKDGLLFEFQPETSFARHINRKSFTDDKSVLEYLKRNVKPGDVCFDIGACFGVVALTMAKASGEKGQVHAFEAERTNFQTLRRNLEINGFRNAKAHNQGVYSDESGFELSVFPKEAYGVHSVRKESDGGSSTQRVETVTLDSLCARQGIRRIDVMKIDVEGVEPEVFKGGAGLLRSRSIGKIIFEVSEMSLRKYGSSIRELTGMLTAHGYSIWEINEDGSLSGPMKEFPATDFDNWVAIAP